MGSFEKKIVEIIAIGKKSWSQNQNACDKLLILTFSRGITIFLIGLTCASKLKSLESKP